MRLVILGATGSVGRSTWDVWRQHRDLVAVDGLVAHHSADRLWEMGVDMGASWIALTDMDAARALAAAHRGESGPRIVAGEEALLDEIARGDITHVLAAMSGFAGLRPTLKALERGLTVLLANKETLVAAGEVMQEAQRVSGAVMIPVDSEHSAIFQCLGMGQPFRRIILTCSGGPFRGRTAAELAEVTVEAALKHPNWTMGPKITVDSATLMNKGLEVIEAHYLFGANYDQIAVVVHPESVVHSLVEFVDGATLAQCGYPDMRVPIQVAMSWPDRWALDLPTFQWPGVSLHFEVPDEATFRLLALAREAGMRAGYYPAVLNAANEVAVAAFLEQRLRFLDIAGVVETVLERWAGDTESSSLEAVIEADRWAREVARQRLVEVS